MSNQETDAMTTLTIRLEQKQAERLRKWAKALGLSQGDLVRLLLNAWYAHQVSVVQGDKALR